MNVIAAIRGFNLSRLLPRHVFFFGLPLILGLAAHAIFNLVDTILVGQLPGLEGAAGIEVTGLCDPVTTFQTILFNGPIAGAGVLNSKPAWRQRRAGPAPPRVTEYGICPDPEPAAWVAQEFCLRRNWP